MLLWRLASAERRRIGFVWALSAAALVLWLATGLPSSPRWIAETARAFLALIGLHLAIVFLFQVILKRWRAPRILSDLIIGAGYAAMRTNHVLIRPDKTHANNTIQSRGCQSRGCRATLIMSPYALVRNVP